MMGKLLRPQASLVRVCRRMPPHVRSHVINRSYSLPASAAPAIKITQSELIDQSSIRVRSKTLPGIRKLMSPKAVLYSMCLLTQIGFLRNRFQVLNKVKGLQQVCLSHWSSRCTSQVTEKVEVGGLRFLQVISVMSLYPRQTQSLKKKQLD
jgi:hypothetical protein